MRYSMDKFSGDKFSGVDFCKNYISRIFALLLSACAIFGPSIVNAAKTNLQSIVLSVHGNIEFEKSEDGKTDAIELDLASLTNLESTTFTTSQPWTDAPKEYTGVRINTLLNHIGADSTTFEALASNEYKFLLSDINFEKYPIIIAYKIDGKFLDARTLGPLLIVFPFDDYPELLNEKNKAASVWQLTEIRVH